MPTKLVVVRNERSTYEIHVETDLSYVEQAYPSGQYVAGQSLTIDRLSDELKKHGCSDQSISQAMEGLQAANTACITLD